ncbi:MAG: metal-dependent transcriptional regulator [Methanobacteriota archaeon]
MPKQNREEYLETIYGLTEEADSAKTSEIAKQLNVKPASVTEMLKKLASEGYIKYQPYHGSSLTKKGLAYGKKIKRKHRLLERFLYDVLGIRKSKVHEQACQMEHSLSDEAADALDRVLDYPLVCPDDGMLIPQKHVQIRKGERRLVNIDSGDSVSVIRYVGGRGVESNLRTLGIGAGKVIKVVTKEPYGGPLVVRVGNTTVTLGRGMASKIIVK